jgi:hypothetical protein
LAKEKYSILLIDSKINDPAMKKKYFLKKFNILQNVKDYYYNIFLTLKWNLLLKEKVFLFQFVKRKIVIEYK